MTTQSRDSGARRMHRPGRLLTVGFACIALAVAGCASGDDEDTFVERPVEELYNEAQDALESGRYLSAVALFDEVERQHPYSVWAREAILKGAYAAYESRQYPKAVASAERFLTLYPSNEDAAYAQYLIALSNYEQISDVRRDQSMTDAALISLREVVNRYPESEYAKDARLKIDLTVDHLAGKEMQVGRYYLKRGHYVGAINRFKTVLANYQTTSHVPEALHRLVEAYLALGIRPEAEKAGAVLGHNYPGSQWYADSYYLLTGEDYRGETAERPGFLRRTIESLL